MRILGSPTNQVTNQQNILTSPTSLLQSPVNIINQGKCLIQVIYYPDEVFFTKYELLGCQMGVLAISAVYFIYLTQNA